MNTNTLPVVKFVNYYLPSFLRDMWMFCCNPSGEDWQTKYCILSYFHQNPLMKNALVPTMFAQNIQILIGSNDLIPASSSASEILLWL